MDKRATFVCAGEALTDLFREGDDVWRSHVGGATWNVARALAALGAPSGFAGAISRCTFGDALYAASAAAGLDLRYLQRVERSPLLAIVPSTNPPHYFFIGDDAADLHFDPQQLPFGWENQVQWMHFGGISLARAPLDQTLISLAKRAKRHGVRIGYDPNWRNLMGPAYDTTLRCMCELADVIKVSDEDLRALFRSPDTLDSLARLRSFNPKVPVLLTRGAAGASLYCQGAVWHARPPGVDVVDTVGAGDASMAGLLYSLQHAPDATMDAHLAFAVAAGSAACRVGGAHAPTLQEVTALRDEALIAR